MRKIKIFDTTLRDGEQAPGCSMNLKEKIEVARCLERLKVDVIEAGFAVASPGDFKSVQTIAEMLQDCSVASLARATVRDIDCAYNAVRKNADPRIHLFLATSPLHMKYKLKMTPEEVLEKTAEMTAYAARYCSNIEFSAEDATRSDPDFLVKVVNAAVNSGAKVVNLPDTVGYSTPAEMKNMVEYVLKHMDHPEKAELSVHCHNDLGMAVANSLAGLEAGAVQVECSINGIGERAGNTALEEIVMACRTRGDSFPFVSDIDTTAIYRASRTVYNIIGQSAPLNKPIVGKNAFLHESGIHQHGVLAKKETYEIISPETIGMVTNNIVLGKHSGKHAFEERLKSLGYRLSGEALVRSFEEFKVLCDKKKSITDRDLEAIVMHDASFVRSADQNAYVLDWFAVNTSNFTTATCTLSLKRGAEKAETVCLGDGPIDAAFKAVDRIINPPEHNFEDYTVDSISEGKDSLGSVTVKLSAKNRSFNGRGLSTDIIEASINAYLNAVNKMLA